MECQPQNPEFRINHENFHPYAVHSYVPQEQHKKGTALHKIDLKKCQHPGWESHWLGIKPE